MSWKGGGTTTDQYPALTFAPGVDYQHVNPQLWIGLNSVLTGLGKRGIVISGYRTNAKSISVGGFANDPHTKGIAADVLVNGAPIGYVPGILPLLASQGIESGNQPGFWPGHGVNGTDPEHVQLNGAGQSTSSPTDNSSSSVGSGLDNINASGCSTLVCIGILLTFATILIGSNLGWF